MTSGLDQYLEKSQAHVSVSHNQPFPKSNKACASSTSTPHGGAIMIRCDVWTDGTNVFTKVKSNGNCVLIFDADTQQLEEMATF